LRIPVAVDLDGLRADLARVPADLWALHFNKRQYEGDWSGVAFRAVGGDARRLYPDLAQRRPYEDTPLLESAPAVKALLDALGCSLAAVRFMRLGAGARILEHRDYDLGVDHGEIRLHVPIVTSPAADFVLDGRAITMRAGECWYLDFARPHRASNSGRDARVHLVIDCLVDDAMRAWLRQALLTSAS
jgi:hypothetical protein